MDRLTRPINPAACISGAYLRIYMFFLFFYGVCVSPASALQQQPLSIVYFNSYHQGYKWSDDEQKGIQDAFKKAKTAAGTIIAAKGSTYYAIGVVINQLVDAVLKDTKRVYPVSVPLTGQYGYKDVSISVPCVIGKNGVEKILEVPLSDEEKKLMGKSVKILKSVVF